MAQLCRHKYCVIIAAMKIRYVHTNIIARDWKKLSLFYQRVFDCKPVPPQRDLKGDWLNRLTCIPDAHIVGEHLVLPGYESNLPTLEIFSYDSMNEGKSNTLNMIGLTHLAFEVDDVDEVLKKIIEEGGEQLGEIVTTIYPNEALATFAYARDIEGNLLEIQNWQKLYS